MAKKKLKTAKWTQKRVKITADWKIIRRKSCKNHRITWKWKTVRKDKYWIEVVWWMKNHAKRLLWV